MTYTVRSRLARFGPFGGSRSRAVTRAVTRRRAALGDVPGTFRASTEAWRDLVSSQAGDIPINFLMCWIDVESGGNPCDYETGAGSPEVGIFQLMSPDNLARAGTTIAQMQPSPPCLPNSITSIGTGANQGFASLSSDQANEQVRAGIQYVTYCRQFARAALDAAGYTDGWTDQDAAFWMLVKMVHVAPSAIPSQLVQVANQLGAPPTDWATWRAATTAWPSHWLDVAQQVGAYGDGGGSVIDSLLSSQTNVLLIAGSVLALTYLWSRS